jgi:hypothetical protein
LGTPDLDVLARAIVDEAPKLHDENVAACRDGYRCVERYRQAVAA